MSVESKFPKPLPNKRCDLQVLWCCNLVRNTIKTDILKNDPEHSGAHAEMGPVSSKFK